jgi:hypothetical protein
MFISVWGQVDDKLAATAAQVAVRVEPQLAPIGGASSQSVA